MLCGIQEEISSEEARVSQSPQQEHRGAVTQLPGARHHPQPCQDEQDVDVNMPWQAQRPTDRAAECSCSVSAAFGAPLFPPLTNYVSKSALPQLNITLQTHGGIGPREFQSPKFQMTNDVDND